MNNYWQKITKDSYIFGRKGNPLKGTVRISGAKNMVTKIMTASLIAPDGALTIKNVPLIGEVFMTLGFFDQIGVKYNFLQEKRILEIETKEFGSSRVEFKGEEGNRISLLLAGPIISRFGQATIVKPKGCKIGLRKIDFHLEGLEKLGVEIKETEDFLYLKVGKNGLRGAEIQLPFPSVGATENMIITASCAEGETTIKNCALEPEIIELIKFLQESGVEISFSKDRSIHLRGTKKIKLSEATIIPDRVETMSLAAAGLSTQGDVFLEGTKTDLILRPLEILEKMGAGIESNEKGIRFFYKKPLKPISIKTEVYPDFPTDFQQPLAIILSQVNGVSSLHETIFENRFEYLRLLNPLLKGEKKFKILNDCPNEEKCRFFGKNYPHLAVINGPMEFGKGEISIPDLRAGFAILNAACLSQGIKISNLNLLFRGYEEPVGKLKALGAEIELVI